MYNPTIYANIRVKKKIDTKLSNPCSYLCLDSISGVNFQNILSDNKTLCQFILDPSSINLKAIIHPTDPLLGSFFSVSRDICFSINERRIKLLNDKKEHKSWDCFLCIWRVVPDINMVWKIEMLFINESINSK